MLSKRLTIIGFGKAFRGDTIGGRVSRVEETETAYTFRLRLPNGNENVIHLERAPIGDGEWEMWRWKGAFAEREFVKKADIDTPQKLLSSINRLLK